MWERTVARTETIHTTFHYFKCNVTENLPLVSCGTRYGCWPHLLINILLEAQLSYCILNYEVLRLHFGMVKALTDWWICCTNCFMQTGMNYSDEFVLWCWLHCSTQGYCCVCSSAHPYLLSLWLQKKLPIKGSFPIWLSNKLSRHLRAHMQNTRERIFKSEKSDVKK